mgnify:CR=1 FL=1|tara:strand:+ start:44 stop:580 length:537 start_codon:yes stop_codon:yes gene_type:complete
MTIEQRLEQVEQQNQQMQLQNQRIQRTNKRLTVALTMTVVAMAAVVTMAATVEKEGVFNKVTANYVNARVIGVTNEAGKVIVYMGADVNGNGWVRTNSAKGKKLVSLYSTEDANGTVTTYGPNGNELVVLGNSDSGGFVDVLNKTGEGIAQMYADDYGNGVVWAGNRKGEGRTLQPGP